ncbi:amidohydrolase family protein [Flavihumibacter sp. UBA7668]|uniref:amidohydrolase family protein n=1 Tax=Flavihumibacter sp. UBA7668 TaxID=1946542 RepID=UPI0025BAF17D|nr:amidohydrolase family protein [Flavihumibacter sp. UBA7668]
MSYRKFKAAQIFTGNSWAPPESVLITSENGQIEAIIPMADAGENVLELDGILCPGFINAHCHLELSHMKGRIAPSTGMVPFLLQVMSRRQAAAEEIEIAMQEADQAMWNNGIVAVGDIANTADSLTVKKNSRIHYHTFIECSGFIGSTASIRFDQAKKIREEFNKIGPSGIVPHAPYSVSPELFRLIREYDSEAILSMHNQESVAEQEFFLSGYSAMNDLYNSIGVDIGFFQAPGTTSLRAVFPFLKNSRKLILVHNLTTSEEDLNFITKESSSTIYFCLCPSANKYINEKLPPVDLLQSYNDNIILGTDSLASNYQLSIIEEIKLLSVSFPTIKLGQLLKWATLNGAKALDMDHTLGSFEKGKLPGIVQLQDWKSKRVI